MFAKRARHILFFAGILLLLTACNFPGYTTQPTISPDLIYTAAAQTLTAQETQASQGTPIVLPSVTATATSPVVLIPTNTPTNTPLPTNTPIPPTPTATPIPCDRAQFVKDVTIPDDTEITAGSTFVKTWQ